MRHEKDESFGIVPLKQEKDLWKVLLILHKGGTHWGFPKGHSADAETPLETAKRELQEETGLHVVQVFPGDPFVEEYQFSKKGVRVIKRVSYFPAVVDGTLKLQLEEIQDAKWVTLEQALTVLTFEEARSICRQITHKLVSSS